jgi:hypothetical protein
MSARLTKPVEDLSVQHVLDHETADSVLEPIWNKAASCLLELSRVHFPTIGALVEDEAGSFHIAGRPLTHNMTDMIRLANIPETTLPLPGQTYRTADEWYTALADMIIAQLIFQHNDCIFSEDGCRNKYVARQIFRRLAREGRLSTFGFAEDDWSAQSKSKEYGDLLPAPSSTDSFRLWGDDLRAGNMLMKDSDDIAAVIDWEYTYVAPTQFILDPPWWLLIDLAETWEEGLDDWCRIYNRRIDTWLSALRQAEKGMVEPTGLEAPLSDYQDESWTTCRFWLNYGARKSWGF